MLLCAHTVSRKEYLQGHRTIEFPQSVRWQGALSGHRTKNKPFSYRKIGPGLPRAYQNLFLWPWRELKTHRMWHFSESHRELG